MTRHMIDIKRKAGGLEMDAPSAGLESFRLLPVMSGAEPRMKRTAISAEPLSQMAGLNDDLVKIP